MENAGPGYGVRGTGYGVRGTGYGVRGPGDCRNGLWRKTRGLSGKHGVQGENAGSTASFIFFFGPKM